MLKGGNILIRGGLGNQMFQVAFAVMLQQRFAYPVRYIDLSARAREPRRWELGCFGITAADVGKVELMALNTMVTGARKFQRFRLAQSKRILVEGDAADAAPTVDQIPLVVAGYWQGERFFRPAKGAVRKLFQFPDLPQSIARARVKDAGQTVAIHVRRGDFVNDPIARALHLVCDVDYYRRAWSEMRRKLGFCNAHVFSDDANWAADNLGLDGEVSYVSDGAGQPAWVDMARMASHDHFIISNSSYSWWAAYLGCTSGKQVIAPKKWYRDRETRSLRLCPEEWILL